MKYLIWVSMIVFWGMIALVEPVVSKEAPFFPYPHENHILENGLKATLIPMKGSGLVAYFTIVRTGSRDEWEPDRSGFAHFFEHMMFRGTEKYPEDAYNRLITETGANANAYTTDDYTCYHLTVSENHLETIMELESDRFQSLSYGENAFRTEAGAVYGEYRKNRTHPWSVANEEILNAAFDRHTYKHTTMGFEKDIQNMPRMYEYSIHFFNRYYRPENCVLLIIGDFKSDAVKKWVEKYYGNWKKGYVAPNITTEPPQKQERTVDVTFNGRTLPLIKIAYKGAAFDPRSRIGIAAHLLDELAFGETSDIYKELVIQKQKSEYVSAHFGFNRDPKLYSIFANVKKEEDIQAVIDAIDRTAAAFKKKPVSEHRLNALKKRKHYGDLMRLDTPENVAFALARFVALTGGIESFDAFHTTLSQVTPDDIRQAAQVFLSKNRRTVLILKGNR